MTKRTMQAIFLVAVSGCSSPYHLDPPGVQVALPSVELPQPTIHVVHLDAKADVLAGYEVNLPDVPFEPIYFRCGVFSDDMLVHEMLRNAEVIFELKGIREVWIPFAGEPKQHFIFIAK